MLGILSFIIALGVIILVHELGHFIVAKKVGILCHEFSIGMGPAVWSKKKGETTYSIRAIPLGGYVAMAGEEAEKEMVKVGQKVGLLLGKNACVEKIYLNPELRTDLVVGTITEIDLYKALTISIETEQQHVYHYQVDHDAFYVFDKGSQQIAPYDRCLESKSKWARFATMAAGATMNFILAIVLLFMVGLVNGETIYSNRLGTIVDDSPAQVAGLQVGDQIIEYNGQKVESWDDLINAIDSTTEETTVVIERNNQTKQLVITPNLVDGTPKIGIGVDYEHPLRSEHSLGYAIKYSSLQTKNAFMQIFETFKMLFVTKEAGVSDLAGPIGIYTMTSQVVTYGLTSFVIWISFLSVNIGIMNLLPLPALDGGRILFVLIEAVIGRPVDRKVEGYIHAAGLILFLGLFVFVSFNDVLRLFK
ncbi:RIP metalloprotease RseP [Turicibacter sanguinis]|uniref:RIP metalloprotease RseP n=1 Tax=Turicibacter sanguinis TaxID=154288 RepID=UPI003999BBC2